MENKVKNGGGKPKNIVILGAGFGGLRVALDLAKKLPRASGYQILILDSRAYHLYSPILYEIATGYFEKENADCEGLLKQGACMLIERFPTIVAGRNIRFLPCDALSVNSTQKEINCSDGQCITYEYLVLAAGAVVDFPPIPGLADHALAMKTADDALAIRRKVRDFIDRRRAGSTEKMNIVICGAGATGVELAGELRGFLRHMVWRGYVTEDDFSVTLVEAMSRVLGAFSATASAIALRRLKHLGVKVMLDTAAQSVSHGMVMLVPRPLKVGERLEQLQWPFAGVTQKQYSADVTVWAGGVRAVPFVANLGLPVDRKGRVTVLPTMQVKDNPALFAIGDCASLLDPVTKQPHAQLARIAIAQGELVADNLLKIIAGNSALKTFKKPFAGSVVPMGGKWALAELGPLRFWGLSAYLLRKLIDLRYFLTILPFRAALIFWWRGARLYIKND